VACLLKLHGAVTSKAAKHYAVCHSS